MKNKTIIKRKNEVNKGILFSIIALGCLVFFAIIGRMCQLALSEEVGGVNLQEFANSRNTTRKMINAKRGTIYDKNGNILAQTVSSYTLIAFIDPVRTKNPNKPEHVVDKEYTAKELAKVIDMDEDAILKTLSKTPYSVDKKNGAYQVYFGVAGKGISELKKSEIDDLNLPGISFEVSQKRYYPYGDFLSYTIGYAKEKTIEDEEGNEITTLVGEMGIEKYYDEILRGKNGYTEYQRDTRGYKIAGTKEVKVDAVDGSDIYLSIDANVQLFLEQAIDNAQSKKYSWEWYTIIAADAKSGAIIGSASNPSFDPNIRNITNYLDYNTQVPFEPGSTMKVYTYMCAMENSNYNGSSTYKSGTYTAKDGTVIGDWKREGWGNITYDRGFALSSNTGIISLLRKNVKQSTLKQYFNKLGFGVATGVEIPGEVNGKVDFRYETEYYNAGFGQGITTTPIQNIKALTSIANDGMLLQPYYVDKIVDHTGKVTYKGERKELYKVASSETVNKMKDLMEDVVSGNYNTCTGYPYYMKGYDLIIKTGSAQVSSNTGYNTGDVIKGIAGMFPKKNPKIIFYIASKKPNDGAGGQISPMTSVVKEVVKNMSSYYGIYHEKKNDSKVDEKYEMPLLKNKDIEVCRESLIGLKNKIVYLGDGTKVVDQYPKVGKIITKKEKIFILTNDNLLVKMPDLKGYSLSEVKSILNLLDIEYEIKGNGFVTKQSIKAGEVLNIDSKIVVTLKDNYTKVLKDDKEDEDKKKNEDKDNKDKKDT